MPGAERDLLMLQGVEPSLRWRRFCRRRSSTRRSELGVEMVITLGALLADVPHTRPVPITGICSDEELVERLGFEQPSYEGPTGIVGVLHHACAAGRPAVGEPVGVGAALRGRGAQPEGGAGAGPRASRALAGVAVDAGELEEAAEDYERQVNAAVASDPEVKAFVERLEETIDEVTEELVARPDQLPSADSIARDFQRFLRQKRADGLRPAAATSRPPGR